MADAEGNTYGPYDIEVPGSGSEPLSEAAWYLLHRESGVVSGAGLTFTGLTATLDPLDLRVHGSFLSREAPWSDASPPTSTASPRRDLLVARRQRTVGEGVGAVPGKTFLTVLRGTPAAVPANPVHDPDNDELLWSWQVPGNGGTVITDVRDHRRWVGDIELTDQLLFTASAVPPDAAVSSVITVPAAPVPYRLVVTAAGRAGFGAAERLIGWDFDSLPGSASSIAKDYDENSRIKVPASTWQACNASLSMDLPAGVPATFRLVYRANGNGYSRGAVTWRRTHRRRAL